MTTALLSSPTVVADRVLVQTAGPDSAGEVYLDLLAVAPEARGTGEGTAALAALCAQADAAGWTIRLGATGDLGADVARLVRWYARAGFNLDRSRPAMWPYLVPMVRTPR
jgi:GNAT superfamily N-acetyltransferase